MAMRANIPSLALGFFSGAAVVGLIICIRIKSKDCRAVTADGTASSGTHIANLHDISQILQEPALEDLVELSNRRPDTKRDDYYYAEEFRVLRTEIRQWVAKYFIMGSAMGVRGLTQLDQNVRERISGGFIDTPTSLTANDLLLLVQAFVMEELCAVSLNRFLPGVREDGSGLQDFYDNYLSGPGGCTFEERVSWKNLTLLSTETPQYKKNLDADIKAAAKFIVESLSPLSAQPPKTTAQISRLEKLMHRAAKLVVEIRREPFTFTLVHAKPEVDNIVSTVSDVEGKFSERHLESNREIVVKKQIYPGLRRDGGSDVNPALIIKPACWLEIPHAGTVRGHTSSALSEFVNL